MKNRTFLLALLSLMLLIPFVLKSQVDSELIVVDQFGYLPDAQKVAVLRDPQTGFDSDQSYQPGNSFHVINEADSSVVYSGTIVQWKSGRTDDSSGDRVWHFDFSKVKASGNYYLLDEENSLRSYSFTISPTVYKEVLKQAARTFFYQRAGFAKDEEYAGKEWADGASHLGPLQDKNCRLYNEVNNVETERDVSGGWYDAGDYNKYTSWTAGYVVEMMLAYLEAPVAWTDDFDLPESGNGVPDLLDEAKWGTDHLLRLQEADGSMISIVGLAHASPPSAADGMSRYGSPNTSATLKGAAAFAISAKVFRLIGSDDYAFTLENAAIAAWDWADSNPDVLFQNNSAEYASQGLGAGQMEMDDYGRLTAKIEAAVFLFELTGDEKYRSFVDQNYELVHMLQWNYVYPYEGTSQNMLLYYAQLDEANHAVAEKIKRVYRNSMEQSEANLPALKKQLDPYMAYLDSYVWGSNNIKAIKGNMLMNLLYYSDGSYSKNEIRNLAANYLHYLHGVNPLNFVYLSNMYRFGAENGVNEFYHSWFTNGSKRWDRVGHSTYGPPPGFLTGGPNPGYDWDGCCPGGCGSSSNNAACRAEAIEPPKNQPEQKSYKDFNTSWPLNSWSVTENSCGYQVSYLRLLSKFVGLHYDCNGDPDGTAYIDSCGNCAGGNTGIEPVLDASNCGGVGLIEMNSDQTAPVRIYPNPAGESVRIESSLSVLNLELYNGRGERLLQTCVDRSAKIDMSMYAPGLYYFRIQNESKGFSQKIVKR